MNAAFADFQKLPRPYHSSPGHPLCRKEEEGADREGSWWFAGPLYRAGARPYVCVARRHATPAWGGGYISCGNRERRNTKRDQTDFHENRSAVAHRRRRVSDACKPLSVATTRLHGESEREPALPLVSFLVEQPLKCRGDPRAPRNTRTFLPAWLGEGGEAAIARG